MKTRTKKLILGLFLFLPSLNILAEEAQTSLIKTARPVTSSQEKLISDAFLYLNKFWADHGKSLSKAKIEKYFDPDTSLIINGRTVYTGSTQFENHFKEVSKNIRGNIRFPLLEVMKVDNNKWVVHFDEDIYDNKGNYYPTNVMAIFTLRNGRIQKWEEVVNSQYFCQTESTSVVYSK